MNATTRCLLLLTVLILTACTGRGDDGPGSGDDVAGGEDTTIDIWWEDTADVVGGVDAVGDVIPDTIPPLDILGDTEPPQDSSADLIGDQLEDVPEDTLEDHLEDSLEDGLDVSDISEGGGDVDEDVVEPPPEPALEITECGELPAPAEGECTVEEGSAVLVIRGDVLAPWEVFKGGEVLISSGGDIGCVGCDCSDQPEYAGTTVITCPDGIVSPGLINAHDHIEWDGNFPGDWDPERFEHRHDWRCGIRNHSDLPYSGADQKTQVIWAELRHVLGGATSIAGAGQAGGFLRNLDRNNALEGLDIDAADNTTFPLGDSGCTLKSSGCDYPYIEGPWVLDNTCFLPHVAEGIDVETRNEFLCLSSTDNDGVDLTEENSTFVHAVGLKAVDAAELAVSGTAVIWNPRTNISLYGHTAQVTMYHTLGVDIGLGTDWTLSGSMTMLRELNCAAYVNDNHLGGFFTDHELWLMATTWNARALEMETAFGSLEVGLVGDVAVFQGDGTDEWHRALFDMDPSHVHLVLRGGTPLYGDLDLVGALTGGGAGCEELPTPECLLGKAVCIEAETGETYLSLLPTNAMHYPLAYCGVPEGEVTCVPFRDGEFDGTITDDDLDGDGVVNDLDNCPTIFNAGRPLDGMVQADHDQDGQGDVCDICPLQADTDECEPPDPNDKDADAVVNAQDNCPNGYNPDQEDLDQDGIGDVCDLCEDYPNPGGAPCPATIYDVKTGSMPAGSKVSLSGVVTAVGSPRFWIQVPEVEQDPELGFRFSGVYAYVPSSNPGDITIPDVGDLVEFNADIKDWQGQIQLDWVADLQIIESDTPVPTPVAVAPEDVATGGPDAMAYEGVLVSVAHHPVTELWPDDGEFALAESLIVDDYLWLTEPFPQLGDVLSVTGPLMWTYDESKLQPRGPMDVVEDLALSNFGPSEICVLGGDGPTTGSAVVTLSVPAPAGGVTLDFFSSKQEAYADGVVFIPEGEISADLDLSTPWIPPFVYSVYVSVAYGEKVLYVEVLILPPDHGPSPIAVVPPVVTAVLDLETMVTVTLDQPVLNANDQLSFEILGDPVFSAPESVTVPFGAQSVEIGLTGIEVGAAQLRAFTDAGELITDVQVLDIPTVGLIITEVLYDVSSGDNGYEWVEVFNGSVETIDLSAYSLANGGTSYGSGWPLQGTLAPGQCFVIGGPLADEKNASPFFDLVLDFEPDIQNSGSTADAVALFAVPGGQVTATTVPVDAVIYGGSNNNGLWDETGAPGEVDAGDASSGSSISRSPDGWSSNPDPTPNDCSHAL